MHTARREGHRFPGLGFFAILTQICELNENRVPDGTPGDTGDGVAKWSDMEKLYLSREGLDGLKADLKALNERRVKVADTIEHARSLGDLKENAEYHSAKEEQAMVHAKIKDLEDKITRAVLIEDAGIDTSQARLGATVQVLNKKTGREMSYKLVNHVEADLAAGKISTKSPVGAALLGTVVGDVAVAKVPAGDLQLEVLSITY